MIDIPLKILEALEANAALIAITGTRLWAESDYPPAGYTPDDGPGIAFKVRGGGPDYIPMHRPSVQFKCYGASEVVAQQCYRALVDALHDQPGVDVRWGQQETYGQTLREPDSGWVFVLALFTLWVRSVEA